MKTLFTEAKITGMLRERGMIDATNYNWKAKFGGMTVSDAQHLRVLVTWNSEPKHSPAESLLEDTLEGCLWPKVVNPQATRIAVMRLMS